MKRIWIFISFQVYFLLKSNRNTKTINEKLIKIYNWLLRSIERERRNKYKFLQFK